MKEFCGCYWFNIPYGDKPDEQGSIIFCPLHAHAKDLLEALRNVEKIYWETFDYMMLGEISKAIAAAQGESK